MAQRDAKSNNTYLHIDMAAYFAVSCATFLMIWLL
jgi:hypothetical protein